MPCPEVNPESTFKNEAPIGLSSPLTIDIAAHGEVYLYLQSAVMQRSFLLA